MVDSTLITQTVNNIDTTKQIWDLVNIENLSTILGITGYSIRDFKGLHGINKFKNLFTKHFPEGLKTETQNSILSDSFLEIKDYIENNPNLDDKIFEKINKVLINGLSTEDMLTRIYIKTLKNLNFIDLIVLKGIKDLRTNSTAAYRQNSGPKLFKAQEEIFKLEICRKLPKELIIFSLKNLEEVGLVLSEGKRNKVISTTNRSYKYISEFGEGLLINLERDF